LKIAVSTIPQVAVGVILLRFLLFILFVLLLASVTAGGTLEKIIPAHVIFITDGDTIVIRLQGNKEKWAGGPPGI
jgi:hypothetical protein